MDFILSLLLFGVTLFACNNVTEPSSEWDVVWWYGQASLWCFRCYFLLFSRFFPSYFLYYYFESINIFYTFWYWVVNRWCIVERVSSDPYSMFSGKLWLRLFYTLDSFLLNTYSFLLNTRCQIPAYAISFSSLCTLLSHSFVVAICKS